MAARDPKSSVVDGRRRAITIHDGARVTDTLVRLLSDLAAAAEEVALEQPDGYRRDNARAHAAPILVARSDGLAVYIHDRRVL